MPPHGHFHVGTDHATVNVADYVKGQLTVLCRRVAHINLFVILQPSSWRSLAQQQPIIAGFANQHVAIGFGPCAIRAGRAEILAMSPTVLHRFQRGLTKTTGNQAIEGSNGAFRVVPQEIRHRLLIVNRFVRESPPEQKEIVFVIVQKRCG